MIAAAILLLLLATTATAQDNRITVTRGEWSRTIPNATVPTADFAALERVIEAEGQPGDKIHIVGTFTGGRLDILDLNKIAGGRLTGDGPEKSKLILTAQHDQIGPDSNPEKPGGPALSLPDNGAIYIAGLYLENTPENASEDGALAGWPGSQSGTSVTIIEDCQVKAHDWGLIYDWSLRSNRTVALNRVTGVAARTFISLVHSASTYQLNLADCQIAIDGSLSRSVGASSASNPVTGGVYCPILIRAGWAHAENCTFSAAGWKSSNGTAYPGSPRFGPTRLVSIATDQYYSKGGPATKFTAKNCRVTHVEPNLATVVYDLDFRYGTATPPDNSELTAAAETQVEPQRAEAQRLTDESDATVAKARGGSGPDGAFQVWTP